MNVHDCASKTLKNVITSPDLSHAVTSSPFPQYPLYCHLSGGIQKTENVCRQRFRIVKIVQVEPYLIADVDYGFSGITIFVFCCNTICLGICHFVAFRMLARRITSF